MSFVGMKTYPSKWHSARDAQRSTVGSSCWAGLVVDWEVVGLTVDSEHEHCELQGRNMQGRTCTHSTVQTCTLLWNFSSMCMRA